MRLSVSKNKMSNTKNKGFVTNSVIALKNFIVKPRLNKEQKQFVKQTYKASFQEIKDLISKYFYVKDDEGTFDLKDDNKRECIIRLIKINSVVHHKDYVILEKYFDSKAEKSLEGEEKELCFLMTELRASLGSFDNPLTEKEDTVRVSGLQMYVMLRTIHKFELLERYMQGKERESLSEEDKKLFDLIQKHSKDRKAGDIVNLEIKHPEVSRFEIWLEDEEDDEEDILIDGLFRYRKLDNVEQEEPSYGSFSYEALKKERAKLYKKLEAME